MPKPSVETSLLQCLVSEHFTFTLQMRNMCLAVRICTNLSGEAFRGASAPAQAPLTTGSKQVKNRVNDGTMARSARSPARPCCRQYGATHAGVGQVGVVESSAHNLPLVMAPMSYFTNTHLPRSRRKGGNCLTRAPLVSFNTYGLKHVCPRPFPGGAQSRSRGERRQRLGGASCGPSAREA